MKADIQSLSIDGWNVVDVSEYESVKAAAERYNEGETAFVFPEGEYEVNEEIAFVNNWGVALIGQPHATIKVTNPDLDKVFTFEYDNPDTRTTVKRITFDFTHEGVGPRALGVKVADNLLVEDVRVSGRVDRLERPPASVMWFNITHPAGSGTVGNLRMPDGCRFDPDAPTQQHHHRIGISVEQYHEGTLRLIDCAVRNFVDNGVYAYKLSGGRTIIEGGIFVNNGNANVRLGPGDVVRDAHIAMEEWAGEGLPTGAGIWAQGGQPLIENCSIENHSIENDCIRVSEGATIRDTTIRNWASARIFKAEASRTHPTLVDNLTVRDYGKSGARNYAFSIKGNGHGIKFQNSSFRFYPKTDGERHGIFVGAKGVVFDDCEIANVDSTDGSYLMTIRGAERADVRFCTLAGGNLGINADSADSVFVGNTYGEGMETNLTGFEFDNGFGTVSENLSG